MSWERARGLHSSLYNSTQCSGAVAAEFIQRVWSRFYATTFANVEIFSQDPTSRKYPDHLDGDSSERDHPNIKGRIVQIYMIWFVLIIWLIYALNFSCSKHLYHWICLWRLSGRGAKVYAPILLSSSLDDNEWTYGYWNKVYTKSTIFYKVSLRWRQVCIIHLGIRLLHNGNSCSGIGRKLV